MDKNLNSDQLIADFCQKFSLKPAEIPVEQIGDYGLIDIGKKDLSSIISKIWRKMAEEDLEQGYVDQHPAEVFSLIRDYARCSILVPDFSKAPAVIAELMQELGGEVSLHDRDVYKAFHLHTQRAGINCEIQFHTPETLALKEAQHISYEKWREKKARNPKQVANDPQYIKENEYIAPLCNAIYGRSGFKQAKPLVEDLMAHNKTVPPMKVDSLLLINNKAEVLQRDLANFLRAELNKVNAQEKAASASQIDYSI